MKEINHLSVHQWLRSAIRDSQQPSSPIGFLFLKLPPPPCAVLLVTGVITHLLTGMSHQVGLSPMGSRTSVLLRSSSMAADASRQAPVPAPTATKAPRWKALRRRDEEGRAWLAVGMGGVRMGFSRELKGNIYGKLWENYEIYGNICPFFEGMGHKRLSLLRILDEKTHGNL